jgi:fructokinase
VTLLGTIEIGGTKTDMSVGTTIDDLSKPVRIPTSDPDTTLDQIGDFFSDRDVAALGVATFGPIELSRESRRFGTMLFTPKPGWTGTPLYDRLRQSIGVPIVISTDVNGAALGEGRWGAARDMADYAYVTVGTGIGAGIVVDGEVVGTQHHPEMGHISVSRYPDDRHEGTCPYHGGCLEGMAAGPALESRFGRPETWAGNDLVVDLATHYLAQGMVALFYVVTPVRIIVGGGVSKLPAFHERLRDRLGTLIAGYPVAPDLDLLISPPGLGDLSGLAGGLVLASSGVG